MIPVEAVEEAAKALADEMQSEYLPDKWMDIARVALEAAAPILMSHEREQTRTAHLDAMVNRETKREELAQAFAYGWREGTGWPTPVNVDTGETLHDEAKQAPWNPYRAAAERGGDAD